MSTYISTHRILSDARVLIEIWAPLGLRYHGLHHLFPAIPYHALGAVHRRLVRALPPDSRYHESSFRSLRAAIEHYGVEPTACSFAKESAPGTVSLSEAAAPPGPRHTMMPLCRSLEGDDATPCFPRARGGGSIFEYLSVDSVERGLLSAVAMERTSLLLLLVFVSPSSLGCGGLAVSSHPSVDAAAPESERNAAALRDGDADSPGEAGAYYDDAGPRSFDARPPIPEAASNVDWDE
jgi:hypothetical protein